MNGKVRRIVTAQSPNGAAYIVSDGLVPHVHRLGPDAPVVVEVWKAFNTPCELGSGAEDPAAGPLTLEPPAHGHVLRICEFPPDPVVPLDAAASAAIFEKMRASHASTRAAGESDRRSMMHRTESLDYGVVLEGEITLLLDDAEVTLGPGDIVVQRGSNHAWSNRSTRVCRMVFFLCDAAYPT
jgi:mannose-6-phosphate isomerase-like protein (cupin superfamily)